MIIALVVFYSILSIGSLVVLVLALALASAVLLVGVYGIRY